MLGAICGDICGSIYEFHNIKTFDSYKDKTKDIALFDKNCHFTDDSVMTLAIFQALQECNGNYETLSQKAIGCMQELGLKHKKAGYGKNFLAWILSTNPKPYSSWGNGSAMRVSPVAYFAKTIDDVKFLSRKVTEVTHNHPEGLKGAEAIAVCVWMARKGLSKETIKQYIENNYYSLDFNYEDLVKNYSFHVGCKNSVPQAIFCFLLGNDFEDCLKTAISIGGDSDTIAAMTGSIAEAYYTIPKNFEDMSLKYLSPDLKKIAKNMIKFRNETLLEKQGPINEKI